MDDQKQESQELSIQPKTLEFPNGKTYTFGDVAFSKTLIRYIAITRQGLRLPPGTELEPEVLCEYLEISWEIIVQSLTAGGSTREEAEEAMASLPMNQEWMVKLRNALGIGL